MFSLLVLATVQEEARLSTVSVLLPYGSVVEYTIEAFNGCFNWEILSPSSILHFEIIGDCGREILIVANDGSRNTDMSTAKRATTILLATEKSSGKKLRCEVFSDHVVRTEIETTTRVLYKDEIGPLTIQGFDESGNLFSTLEGLEFEWNLLPLRFDEASSILQIVPFKECNFEAGRLLQRIESTGRKSSIILVQGIDTGVVNVNARVVDPLYSNVAPASVEISVLVPLHLNPFNEIYILTGTVVQYDLSIWRRGDLIPIDMPNDQYEWSTTNSTVATVSQTGSLLANVVGDTAVKAQYRIMQENYVTSFVYVVDPAYLGLEIVSSNNRNDTVSYLNNYYLINENDYDVNVIVYEKNGHKIFKLDKIQFSVTLSSQYFNILGQSSNRQTSMVRTITEGVTEVTASIERSLIPQLVIDKQIRIRTEVFIVSSIRISPDHLILPPEGITYQLACTGGSGNSVVWGSSLVNVATVTQSGFVKTDLIGTSTVSCYDSKDQENKDSIDVKVVEPHSMRFVQTDVVETEVGTEIFVHVNMYDDEDNSFSNCSGLEIFYAMDDSKIMTIESYSDKIPSDYPHKACGFVKLRARNEGFTTLRATYKNLRAETLVVAFNPLIANPETSLVTLGSLVYITVDGGPIPWPLQQGLYYEDVEATQKDLVTIEEARYQKSKGTRPRVYSVLCNKLGEQDIIIRVGNEVANVHPILVKRELSVKFSCTNPSDLFIHLTEPIPANEIPLSCAEGMVNLMGKRDIHNTFKLRNHRTVNFQLVVLDEKGVQFNNYSTLNVEWSISNDDIAALDTLPHAKPFEATEQKMLTMGRETGHLRISLSSSTYKDKRLRLYNPLSRSFDFDLYAPLKVIPSVISVYYHPNNKVKLTSIGGSGMIGYSVNDTSIVHILRPDYETITSELYIKPVVNGVARMTVNDVCVPSDEEYATILVSDIHQIILASMDMVQVGHSMDVQVKLLDKYGNEFTQNQEKLVSLRTINDNDHILATRNPIDLLFPVTGKTVGTTSVTVQTDSYLGSVISSLPKQIHVYPPLKISPSEINLIPGATRQLEYSGGPPMRSDIVCESSDNSLGVIHQKSSVFEAKMVGNGFITCAAYVFDPVSNEHKSLGTTSIPFYITYLDGIRIQSASNVLIVGEEMIIEVAGSNGQTPFVWGDMDVRFKWKTGNNDVIGLEPFYHDSVTLDRESSFVVRIKALYPGRTKITVEVIECAPESRMMGMEASFYISTMLPLELVSPKEILVTPNSKYQIKTTYDNNPEKRLKYTLLNTDCKSLGNTLITVDSKGYVEVQNTAGISYILVEHETSSQSVIVKVIVKPAHHIELRPKTPMYEIPVGQNTEYQIVVRDEVGREFHRYDGMIFGHTLGISNVVGASLVKSSVNENHKSLSVNGLGPGKTVLELHTEDGTNLRSHTPIFVGSYLLPANARVVPGTIIRYQPNDQPDSLYLETWSSSNPDVVSINSQTGVALARNLGKSRIYHNSSVSTFTDIYVVKISELVLDTKIFTDNPQSNSHIVPIHFYDSDENEITQDPNINLGFELDCSVDRANRQSFTVSNYTESGTNKHHCYISTNSQKKISSITLSANVKNDFFEVGTSVEVSLSSMFFISNENKAVELTDEVPRFVIRVHFPDNEVLNVKTIESRLSVKRLPFGSGSVQLYEIEISRSGAGFYSSPIEFINARTGQKETVLVSYKPSERVGDEVSTSPRSTTRAPRKSNLATFLTATVTVAVGVLIVWGCAKSTQTPTFAQDDPNAPYRSPPRTTNYNTPPRSSTPYSSPPRSAFSRNPASGNNF